MACVGTGFAAFGYVHNAVDTHTAFSVSNLKAGVDTGVFGACFAATAGGCAALSVGATAADYLATAHDTGQWGGANARSLAIGLGLDAAGYGFGKFFEQGAEAIQRAREIGAVHLSLPGGTRLPLSDVEGGLFGTTLRATTMLPQVAVNNLIRAGNYDFVTMTCTNPFQGPFYCQG